MPVLRTIGGERACVLVVVLNTVLVWVCRTCCTGGAGLWWTTRTLTRPWTRLEPRTETSCRQRPASSSVATSLRRSQSPPSKVRAVRSHCWERPLNSMSLVSLVSLVSLMSLISCCRARRLQDEASGGFQEEPGGAGRAGTQTRQGN